MFERPIVLSTDKQLNKNLLQNLTLSQHLAVINKLLNDYYVNVNPAVALKLIIPQKQKMIEEKNRICTMLIESFPLLADVKTFDDYSNPQKVPPQLSRYINQTFYTASVNYHNSVAEHNNQTIPVSKDRIAVTSLYPLLVTPHLLDDDHIQLPIVTMSERKKIAFPLLSMSMTELKTRLKKSVLPLQDCVDTALMPLMQLSQKINAFLTFAPHEIHYELAPTFSEFAKSLEWVLTSTLTKEKVASIDSKEKNIVKIYQSILTDQLYMLYLYISETITYHPTNTLEELNYAEWCSDKFYDYHLFGEENILQKNNLVSNKIEIDPSRHKQKLSIRYFLNRTLIEAKRDSLDLSLSFYEDFLVFVENDIAVLQHVEMTRCYANLDLILEKSLVKPDLFLLKTAAFFHRTLDILRKKPEFLDYIELHSLVKKAKYELLSYFLKNELGQSSNIKSHYNLLQNSLTFSLPNDLFIRRITKIKSNPTWLENFTFDSQKNTITIIIKDASLSLTSPDNFQDIRTFANYLSRNIQTRQSEQPKTLKKPTVVTPLVVTPLVVTPLVVTPLVVTPVVVTDVLISTNTKSTILSKMAVPQLEKLPPVTLSPVANEQATQQNEINKLERKLSQVTLQENRSRKKSSSESVNPQAKPEKKRDTKSPEKPEKKPEAEPKVFTAKELGFKHFPNHLVTPIYFGLNQKKKSTNTYVIWDSVANLSSEAEEHFKAFLDPQGITVAKNIDDAGIKIHRPPSEKNNPLHAFIRLKSKSKNFGSTRVEAIFEEEASSILPENEDMPMYLYRFGKSRRK